ncbi:Asp-tRNA(Asn)/Glu-tRNA(Gln) amidotransferase subunit GatB [Ethanoligenens harbinense]|uniref:Aspartyl/glutamyl-tRNA(Asn/Gln) amidotransferase subunit B n=1 Tax=Ethanoligenens harbinense (strain DSM 18485 / JCM 12961 / CGMCC 1.5033 / YUAN-3) TaxID=663278 RepID=E6U4M4_ETHHY|nr:Asp-tRNA(Asn)/Glu-tRNA(Gln) amidotransferase subunit GatB [Ethanoligenens harbinense]ADU26652.1 glutamyl-tRNA(Gln) amidotransferase, B subunit [Ethanoligenens harbinense YUAN-3]AVQ95771.1 Asp-tRNA(Asn)/Glu-tRNA(Gln) amidotransferase subunit GatB [Ethanoligenens harbinense YUAN-3]AYF38433.1 Asp-tRNA(Asn)/Glu-tRNA(Gln) amidotransferase subunit GatB [Ethanoligenens harbinense]AYF41178.1 Asp-tRNA(Asn)/Glu-tRNA(Gln) amidotransferase subunit GatB [Ethanoligenens harbinense]QCN92010.1 Asp-tRNA(Asn
MAEYEIVVGLEIHAELSTKTKIFCGCETTFGGEPNTHCCPVCTGMPGTLPVLNERVVEYAVRAGLAMDCEIAHFSKLDRKNYFYPDLPKAYQISQFDLPLCKGGYVTLDSGKKIGITRIHIEEDAGKLVHDKVSRRTFVDYNRCGVPLIEIVSEPDMRSAEEVHEYVEKVRAILLYADVSDCRMEEGSLRADVNLSVRRKGAEAFGTRTEMKNINSLRAIYRAVLGESKRQIEELEAGGHIVQQTRRWDDNKGASRVMRSKEEADDYRYFPEPDVVPVKLNDARIENIRATLPKLPAARVEDYVRTGVAKDDAVIITASRALADFYEQAAAQSDGREAAKWIVGEMMRQLKDRGLEPEAIPFPPAYLADLIVLCQKGEITAASGKKVFGLLFDEQAAPAALVKKYGLRVVGDADAIGKAVEQALDANPKSITDFKNGKEKAFGFLMGQCMRILGGKADPAALRAKLTESLNNR